MENEERKTHRWRLLLGLLPALLLLALLGSGELSAPASAVRNLQAQLPGDADGDGRCTEVDALAALQVTSGVIPPDPKMDVDGDGKVTEVDALTIIQWAAAGGQCASAPTGQPPTQPPVQPPAGGGPQITALEPPAAAVGDQVTVRGTSFSTQGILTLNSLPLDAATVMSWNDTEIVFQIPVGALSGPVRVVVATTASNALRLEVISSFTLPQPADVITDTAGIERVKSQIMVGFQTGTDQATIDQILSSSGGKVVGYDSRLEVYQLEIAGADETQIDQAVAALNSHPEVEFAAPRFGSIGTQPPPNDPEYPAGSWAATSTESRNWWHRYMRLSEAWDIAQGSVLVPLAVVDNGFMTDHPDLRPNVIFTAPGNSIWDDELQPHGTHVAGIAGAAGNNSFGVSGVNWRTNFLLFDWNSGAGVGVWDRIANHMVEAMDRGARVINLSAGIRWRDIKANLLIIEGRVFVIPSDLTPQDLAYVNYVDQTITRALRYAARTNRDVLVSFSAGNDALPATYNGTTRTVTRFPNVMVVAAIEQTTPGTPGTRTDFSNHGDLVNIAAPGRDIYSTVPQGTVPVAPVAPGYDNMSGTSMAAPAVAGLAALTFSMNPNLTAVQVKDCILAGAETRGQPVGETDNPAFGPHNFYAVDAFETLRSCQGLTGQPQPQPPPAQPLPPWKQPAVIACIERWLRMQIDELNRTRPGLAPWWVDQYGHLRNKAVIDARAPDDWISRWEGDRYKRIWFLWRPVLGLPPLQTYCAGEVDDTPQPVPPAPASAPGTEPWNNPSVVQCINNWMGQMLSCANRTWADMAPHRWTQYGLLVNKATIDQQPPDGWGSRYEGNKYKWIWLEYDARVGCPGVPSVQDSCSGALSGGTSQPPSGPGTAPSPAGSGASSRFLSIDNSGSMSGQKIEEARRAALNTVANLPADTEMALQFFGTSGCNVEVVLDFTTDRNAMSEAIKKAGAHGSTPLAKAIEEAAAYVQTNAHTADRAIILLTDGGESCSGDPVEAARKINAPLQQPSASAGSRTVSWLRAGGKLTASLGGMLGLLWPAKEPQAQAPPIRLHVVGFGIQSGSSTEQQLQQVAAAGGGQYFQAGTEAQLTQALQQAATQPTGIKGDADGDGRCTEVDALAALRMAAGADTPDLALDIDGDGQVSETDGLTIIQWAAAGGQCGP